MASALSDRLRRIRVTPRAFALFAMISVLAPVFTDFTPGDTLLDLGLELSLGIIATIALGGFLWPALVAIRRWAPEGAAYLGWLIVAVAGGGAIRGLVLHYWGPDFSYIVTTTVGERVANSVGTTLAWLLVFSLFTSASEDFSERYSAVVQRALYQRATSLTPTDIRGILGDVEHDLRTLNIPPGSGETPPGDMEKIAVALRSDVIKTIRDHSRELWSLRGASSPTLRFIPLVRLAIVRLDYSVGFLLAIFATFTLGNLASNVGAAEALVRMAGAMAALWALDAVWRRWLRAYAARRPWINALHLVSLGVAVMFPMGLFEFYGSGTPASYLILAVLPLPVAALPLIESAINLTQLARQELLDLISGLDGETQSDDRVAPSRSDLASYLHNSLQAEIQSIIHALEGAAGDPDKVGLGQASLERLRMLSARSLDEDFDSFSRVPLDHLHALIDSWRGILEITLEWNLPAHTEDDPRLPTVVNIIQEVSSNAVVHGNATKLAVTVMPEEDDIAVTITNNANLSPPTSVGQGSSWLDSFLIRSDQSNPDSPETTVSFRV